MNAETWQRWKAGRCPCCGADMNWWNSPPEVIAEGVMICGRCSENDHLGDSAPGLREAMLEAIARRDDEPIARLLPGSYINCAGIDAV